MISGSRDLKIVAIIVKGTIPLLYIHIEMTVYYVVCLKLSLASIQSKLFLFIDQARLLLISG